MRRHFAIAGICLLLTLGLTVTAAFAEGKTMTRTEDSVIVRGDRLSGAQGWPIALTRLYRLDGEKATPVPFQIDERLPNNEYALPFGRNKSADDGKIDGNDELVFMIKDAGDRGARALLPDGADQVVEITLTDPVNGGKAWLYLLRFPNNPPPVSPIDYVQYDNTRTVIDTVRFRMGFHPKAPLSIGELVLKPEGGGRGQDLVDRLKIRFTAKVMGVDLIRNEEDFVSDTIGWIDGPVRIVRRTINQVKIWKLKSPKAYTDNVYFLNSFEFPTFIEMPFRTDLLISEPRFRVSTDGLCVAAGRVFSNSNNPAGVKVDGVMSEAENKLNPAPYTWSLVTDPSGKGAWMNRLLYDAASTKVRPMLYYRDDMKHPDGPEDEAGECGDLGYTLENMGTIKSEKLYLKSILYNIPDYQPARIQEFMNILDRPIKVAAQPL
ncbi:MAG: hypothetical protein GX444_07630 [Myxococcales bacterium]|nr:hypothetical protein [Myxococcales bacterium]